MEEVVESPVGETVDIILALILRLWSTPSGHGHVCLITAVKGCDGLHLLTTFLTGHEPTVWPRMGDPGGFQISRVVSDRIWKCPKFHRSGHGSPDPDRPDP